MNAQEEIKAKIQEQKKLLKGFNDVESEGLALSIMSEISKLERELHKLCSHANMKTEIKEEHTQDARKRKREIKTCPDCGFHADNIVWEEKVSDDAIWR
jgi:hypothetical protein